ncbi:MAG: hypothetical protein LBQ50_07580 [Planctomycetaceae bacterium]|nr:hypothetical protein [Planctomycetaceae bacterium]
MAMPTRMFGERTNTLCYLFILVALATASCITGGEAQRNRRITPPTTKSRSDGIIKSGV